MIKNYIKIALRNFSRNRFYLLMNISGLALGIGCSVVAFFNWDFHVNFNSHHTKLDNLVRVNTIRVDDGIEEKHAITPFPLGFYAKNNIASVVEFARYTNRNGNVALNDKVLTQNIAFVDSSFLKLLHFPIYQGSFTSLKHPKQTIITQQTAIEYFGNEPALGQELTIIIGDQRHLLIVGGIIENHKLNSSFKFDLLMNIDAYEELYGSYRDDWSTMVDATFLLLSNDEKISNVENHLNPLVDSQNEANEDWQVSAYFLTPFSEMADEARYLRSNHLGQNNPEGTVMIPTIMATMILLIACFNFTNTSIAMADKRIKEIGVRKALGANKNQLRYQLLTESMIIVLFSLGLGLVIAEMLLPLYSSLGPWIDLSSNYSDNLPFFGFLALLTISVGFLAAVYPALYISGFNVISIFRKKIKVRDSNWFTKTLLILQISFSLMASIQGVVYVQNSILQSEFDLGFNRSSIISISLTHGSEYQGLQDQLMSIPSIESVAMTTHHIGYSQSGGRFKTSHLETEVRRFDVDPSYLAVMEIDLIDGRHFNEDNVADQISSILVNETLVRQFGITDFTSPYTFEEKNYQIIGVVQDFYPYGLWRGEENHPAVFTVAEEEKYQYMIVNVGPNDILEMNEQIKRFWKDFNPEIPYEGEVNNKQVYLSELLSNNMIYFSFFQALVASLLSITGLFTMVSLNIQNRYKEMGIRKIFGASAGTIVKLFNKPVLLVILSAGVIGSISSYYLTELFLDIMFSKHAHVTFEIIVISLAAICLLTYSVIGYKLLSSARENPIDTLKHE